MDEVDEDYRAVEMIYRDRSAWVRILFEAEPGPKAIMVINKVQHEKRRWNPKKQTWQVHQQFAPLVKIALQEIGYLVSSHK